MFQCPPNSNAAHLLVPHRQAPAPFEIGFENDIPLKADVIAADQVAYLQVTSGV